jgi:hypothetical protein
MSKLYCAKTDVEKYLAITIAISIDDYIQAISQYIKEKTQREWKADTTTSERFYNGNGYEDLRIDDFIDTPIVKTGEDYNEDMVARTDFVSMPFNSTSKHTILLKNNYFDCGIQNISVEAKWGYAEEVPEDIKHATVVLVSAIVLAQTNTEGEVESEKIGNYQVKYRNEKHKDDVQNAMDIIESRVVLSI